MVYLDGYWGICEDCLWKVGPCADEVDADHEVLLHRAWTNGEMTGG